jgi:predicted nucleic acid-binding protein
MILLDTSVLVDCLAGLPHSALALRAALASAERIGIPSLVLYEWLRGPRRKEELAAQQGLFPSELAIPFGAAEAAISATVYRKLRKPRGHEVDIAIAACAINYHAALWTLNVADFADIPGLQLYQPASS